MTPRPPRNECAGRSRPPSTPLLAPARRPPISRSAPTESSDLVLASLRYFPRLFPSTISLDYFPRLFPSTVPNKDGNNATMDSRPDTAPHNATLEAATLEASTLRTRPGGPSVATYRRRLLGLAAALAALGGLAFSIDLPVARWFKAHRLPSEVMRLLNFSEVFAHGTGVAVILIAAIALDRSLVDRSTRVGSRVGGTGDERHGDGRDPSRADAGRATARGVGDAAIAAPASRWHLLRQFWNSSLGRLIAAAYTGGLLVDVVKALVDRVRPRAADLATAASALATFGEQATAGLVARGISSNSDFNSFPSGHSATAAGLAAALAWRYPRGGWLFALLAALGAMQRVATLAHYPSDACLGAALGVLGAAIFLGPSSTGAVECENNESVLAAGRRS